jgi:hypothetical protein
VKRKIGDADDVPVPDGIAVSLQGLEGPLHQGRINLGAYRPTGWRPFGSGPGECSRRQPGERQSYKKTTRN